MSIWFQNDFNLYGSNSVFAKVKKHKKKNDIHAICVRTKPNVDDYFQFYSYLYVKKIQFVFILMYFLMY